MYIPISDRARSIRNLANLLKPGGKLVYHLDTDPNREKQASTLVENYLA
jgi:SAM-dependent methyltransferase